MMWNVWEQIWANKHPAIAIRDYNGITNVNNSENNNIRNNAVNNKDNNKDEK